MEWNGIMPSYHFALRDVAGRNEDLGVIDLADDKDAVAFGQAAISDILQEGAAQYAGSDMDITERRRQVERLNFEHEMWRARKIV
jgi:hypothetical protein